MTTNNRVMSRDPLHLREDLAASLVFALGDDPGFGDVAAAADLVESMQSFDDSQQCLHDIRTTFGKQAFGRATLFHLAASTSLRGQSETLTRRQSLAALGMAVRDLEWPLSQMSPFYAESAVEDPELEQRLEAAVAAWKLQTRA